MRPAADSEPAARAWWLPAAVALVAVAVYANSLPNGFVLDDVPLIEQNHQLRFLSNISRFFRQDYFQPSMEMGLYRPLPTVSYALTMALAGEGPWAFHAGNILLHAANSLLLLWLVWRITRDRLLAGGTAFLFAAHAVHSEAVASVSFGRPELLAALFGLTTLHLHCYASRARGPRANAAGIAAFAAFGLALLSKESAIAVLGVVLLLDWVFADTDARLSLRTLWSTLRSGAGRYVGYVLVALAYLGARELAIGEQLTPPVPFLDNPLGSLPVEWRIVNATLVSIRYAGLLMFPRVLCSDYSFDVIPIIDSPTDPALLLGAFAIAAVGLAAAWSYRRDRVVFFGLAFLLTTFSVASNGLLPIGTIFGERLLYLPSAGFCLLLVRVLQRSAEALSGPSRRQRQALVALLALLTVAHGSRAVARNSVWKDEHTLRFHDVAVHPTSAKLQSNAGASYVALGQPERALAHFEAAIALGISADVFVRPFQGKVRSLVDLGRWREAKVLYEDVIHYGAPDLEIERRMAEAAEADRILKRGAP